jgi:hypothetical protein
MVDRSGTGGRRGPRASGQQVLARVVDHGCEQLEDHVGPLPETLARRVRRLIGDVVPCAGTVHLLCPECHDRGKIAFQCDGGCPLCKGVSARAGPRLDRLIPRVPVRHWVLSLPHRLRERLAEDPGLARKVGRVFVTTIFRFVRETARLKLDITGPTQCGCVSVTQRCGAALNLDVHFHALVLDGVYVVGEDGEPVFHPIPDPESDEVAWVAEQVRVSVMQLFEKHGSGSKQERALLRQIQSASVRHEVATGPRAGKRVRRIKEGEVAVARQRDGQGVDGFRVHAGRPVREQENLERLCRYVTRPPIDLDALEERRDGRIRYRLRRPFSDGTTHVEFDAAELVERLAALVPAGPLCQVSYHGALAPGAAVRWQIVPGPVQQRLPLPPAQMRRDRRAVAREKKRPARARQPAEPESAIRCRRCDSPMLIVAVEDATDSTRDE